MSREPEFSPTALLSRVLVTERCEWCGEMRTLVGMSRRTASGRMKPMTGLCSRCLVDAAEWETGMGFVRQYDNWMNKRELFAQVRAARPNGRRKGS